MLTVTLKNQLAELERVSHVVEEFGEKQGLPARVIFDANLSLDEVLTNIISYAYEDAAEHDVVVRLSLSESERASERLTELLIEVEDDGRPFNPLEVEEPDVTGPAEHRPIGGLGLRLVRKLMTGLEYRRRDGKNVLMMRRLVAE